MDIVDHFHREPSRFGIEAGQRLVEEQDARLPDENAGHRGALLLSAGQRLRR
ncbi:hypothetical protein BN871_AI_01120 [Paenibacillus sp. P22]|nr:hypothetical protein BN871_AI_01120 [Paenibacillus sp. P22]